MFCPTIYQRGFIPISFTFPTICLFFYKWILLHQKKVVDFGPFSHPESFWGLVFSLQGLSQKSLRTGYRRYHPGGQKKQKPPSSRAPLKKKVRWRRNFRRRFFHIGYIYIYVYYIHRSPNLRCLSVVMFEISAVEFGEEVVGEGYCGHL